MQLSCFSKNAINSLRRNLRLISTFPVSFTPWIWNTDLAVSRPIMVMLMAGGSLVAGSDNPHFGTSMPLGPSTPSVGLNATRDRPIEEVAPKHLATPDIRRMSNFRPIDRETGFLLPPSVDEWLPERHLARFVVEVVGGLDLRSMTGSYRGSGEASYHPELLLGLIVYGYATGVFSSRKLERASYDSVAFRFIAANEHPDHDTIAAFRRRFLKQIETLFVQVLGVAREMGVLKLGTVALDGTKIHANASRHSALSYEHASKIEAQLQAEVADLLRKAEAADQADVPDGMSIPEELARREARLAAIARAKAMIEARAKERHARERAEYEAKLKAREAKTAATGKKPGGRPPAAPTEGPLPTDQVNLTDEESRIMPVAGGGFEQCYNAQAMVAADSLLVIAADVVQAPNDKQQLEPMLGKLAATSGLRHSLIAGLFGVAA